MSPNHAVVWLDHREAHVMFVSSDDVETFTAHASDDSSQVHRKNGPSGSGRMPEDTEFFGEIVTLLGKAQQILVIGPGNAKLELVKYAEKHQHELAERIVAVETVDHPTDPQVVAYARTYFAAHGGMRDGDGNGS